MQMVDVNVLVYAHRPEMPDHTAMREWFDRHTLDGPPFGMSEIVLSAFVRLVTNRRIYATPTPTGIALEICGAILNAPNCVVVRPGANHWAIFDRLCRAANAVGTIGPRRLPRCSGDRERVRMGNRGWRLLEVSRLTWRHPLRGAAMTNPG